MNRGQMIAAGQEVYVHHWRKDPDSFDGACSCGNTLDWGGRYSRHVVEAMVDAILPQVATVEELEALPDGVRLLISGTGELIRVQRDSRAPDFRFRDADKGYWHAEALLRNLGPLTVVWQP